MTQEDPWAYTFAIDNRTLQASTPPATSAALLSRQSGQALDKQRLENAQRITSPKFTGAARLTEDR